MDPVSLSKADRFFPLIAHCPEGSGGCISLQNIMDLQDNGMIDALRNLQQQIIEIRAQSQLYDDSLLEEPLIGMFFHFVDCISEVAAARRVIDSGHFLTVSRQDGGNISLDPEHFFLTRIKNCLQYVQERYGRFDLLDNYNTAEEIRGNTERIIAMTKWLLLKNHAIDYLMGFEVTRIPGTHEYKVKVPKWDGSRPIPEAERLERLSEVESFLIACCHPGRLGVFPAATVQIHNE